MDWGTFFTLFPLAVAIGFIASLLGLGGGVFMTPLLLLGGFVATQPDAAGTSVAAVVFTGLSASIAYFKRKVIDYRIGLMFMPTAIAGVFLGKWIIQSVDPSWLTIAFGVFLLYPMTMMLLGKTPKDAKARLKGWSSGVRYYVLVGIIGLAAGVATKLFGTSFPDWFGTLGRSAYSLFQIMTLESWSMGIVRPVMEVYPYAWAFFLPFILVTTFAVVNLLVGLIVNSMQDAHHEEDNQRTDAYRDEVLARLDSIEAMLAKRE